MAAQPQENNTKSDSPHSNFLSLEADNSLNSIEISFGNPSVENVEGIIHYFKDPNKLMQTQANVKSRMLCIYEIPLFVTIKDLVSFTDSFKESILEMKVVRDATPNIYMVLLLFTNSEQSISFYRNFNNSQWNSFHEEVCKMFFVSHVDSVNAAASTSSRPSSSTSPHIETSIFPLSFHGLEELPSCSVCLEKLDEPLTGIISIMCNHTFHNECIARATQTNCPVCRYCQTLDETEEEQHQCADCDARSNLWLCLICGNIGCARNNSEQHAKAHFEATGHNFSLELGKNVVWDYVSDMYVHRLIANTGDGKLVEIGEGHENPPNYLMNLDDDNVDNDDDNEGDPADDPNDDGGDGDEAERAERHRCRQRQRQQQRQQRQQRQRNHDSVHEEKKMNQICLEYTALLSSQLDSQRMYLEEKYATRMSSLEASEQQLTQELEETRGQLREANRDRSQLEKRLGDAMTQLGRAKNNLSNETEMNASLLEKQTHLSKRLGRIDTDYAEKLAEKTRQIAELEEQMRDLMMNFEMQSQLQQAQNRGELATGELDDCEVGVSGGGAAGQKPAGRHSASNRLREKRMKKN